MSWSTFGIALVVLVALLRAGHALPPVPGFLVFVALLALSTNHDVVFPSEYAASADLAVVLAAVVAVRHDTSHDAALVAPLLLGLLTGPLDVVQWRRRAFVRMAWNSGDRALAGLAAAGAFAAVAHVAGESVVATVGAALAAAVAATLVDTALSLVLVTALGNALRAGWRTVVDIDVLQFPLACAGAAAGFLVAAVGAWAVVPPMLALVLLPELVQARSRVPAILVRDVLLVLEVGVACLVVAPFVGVPDARTICLLLAVAVLVGAELVVDTRVGVPAVLGVVVVMAAIGVAGADDGAFVGLLVAAGATAAAWCCTRVGGRGRAPVAVAIAALGGGLVGALVDQIAAIDPAALALAVSAVLLFALVVITVAGAADARAEGMRMVWAFPLVALGVGAAALTATADGRARVVPCALLGIGALAAAWCGATPWRSRVLSRRLGAVAGRGRAAVCVGGALAAFAATGAAFLVDGDVRVAAAVVVLGAGDIAAAMALTATRQWRFAPRARARDATLLVVAATLFALAGVGTAMAEWWSVPAVAVATAITIVIGRDAVARSDELGAMPKLEIRR